jgi:hypothetical protein
MAAKLAEQVSLQRNENIALLETTESKRLLMPSSQNSNHLSKLFTVANPENSLPTDVNNCKRCTVAVEFTSLADCPLHDSRASWPYAGKRKVVSTDTRQTISQKIKASEKC